MIPRSTATLLVIFALVAGASAEADPAEFEFKKQEGGGYLLRRAGQQTPFLVLNSPPDGRPFIHPLHPPDGKGVLTELSPDHHKHQTGLYVGFVRVNGRDYFHNRGGDYFRFAGASTSRPEKGRASLVTMAELLDQEKRPILEETQKWDVTEQGGAYYLDLDWKGKALVDVTFAKYDYGGLFLRMPWKQKTGGEAVNSEGKKNGAAEGQRARWVDVGMPIEGRDDWAHIAILDHKENANHPVLWRVDGQLGVGPAPSRAGEWKIAKGETARLRYRLVIYTGKLDTGRVEKAWKDWGKE